MKRRSLKPFVLPMLYTLAIVTLVLSFYYTTTALKSNPIKDNTIYVSEIIFDESMPVVNVETTIVNPFTNEEIKIGRYYYDYNETSESKQNSLIFYKNTYIPNTGVDYTYTDTFDVIAILDGTVISVKTDEILGKIVEIRHNNEIISVYQALSEALVNEGDIIAQGQTIGKSGTSEINKDLNNHLHFELYHNGKIVNPLNYIGKKLSELN